MWGYSEIQKQVEEYAVGSGARKMYRREALEVLFRALPRLMPVDEQFYLERYPDVRDAVNRGDLDSGAQHFIEHGFFEGRIPINMRIDEKDYLSRYPDVAEEIESGSFKNATEHWLLHGRHEGRTASFLTTSDSNGPGTSGLATSHVSKAAESES